MQVRAYDGRLLDVTDPHFRFPLDYISLSRGFTANYHGGLDPGWNSNYGGPNVPLYTVGQTNRITVIKDDGAWNSGYGNYIMMESDGYQVLFGHCLRGSFVVKVGDVLGQGVKVCQMNNSGNSTGSHVHYEVRLPGTTLSKDRIDPLPLTYVYPGQIVGPGTACKDQIKHYDPAPTGWVGIPVERNAAVNQVIPRTNANMHSRPENNTQTILGKATIGYYNALETRDMTHEDSNRKYWYRVADGQWLYDADYFAGNPSVDKDKIIAELEAQAAALTKSAEQLTAALVSVRDTADKAIS